MISLIARARELRAKIEALAFALDDDAAIECAEFYPRWHTDTVYDVGIRVRDPNDNFLYKCLQAHTSQDSWTPAVSPSLWAKVIAADEGEAPLPWEQPDSTNGYEYGAVVTYNGHTWRNIFEGAGGNIWEPGVYGWEQID